MKEKIDKLLEPMTLEQTVKFAMYCALEVSKDQEFISWAKKWLSGEDRNLDTIPHVWCSPIYPEESAAAYAGEAARWFSAWGITERELLSEKRAITLAIKADPQIDLEKLAKKAMEE